MNEHEEMEHVLGEVSAAMGGWGAALSIHPDDGGACRALHMAAALGTWGESVRRWVESSDFWSGSSGQHYWAETPPDIPLGPVLLIPVQRNRGHSQLVISIFFKAASAQTRERAERAYLQRRPFAIGYFRLWQVERSRRKQLAALRSALNLNQMAVMLLDQEGRLVFANSAADQYLREGDGLARRNDRVVATRMTDAIKLATAIGHVAGDADEARPSGAPLFRIARKEGAPLVVTVLPTEDAPCERSDVAAILFVIDPADNPAQQLQPICKLYHLTPLETRLTCLLTTGATLQEAAQSLRLKEQTARSYLKQIFVKTDTNRQSDLIRLILKSAVPARSVQTEAI